MLFSRKKQLEKNPILWVWEWKTKTKFKNKCNDCSTPFGLVNEVVWGSYTVSKVQLWLLTFYKITIKINICILLWKYFAKQIYSCGSHISKLNELRVVNDLYSQFLTQTMLKTTSFTQLDGVSLPPLPLSLSPYLSLPLSLYIYI
jgi:hypothetical protein